MKEIEKRLKDKINVHAQRQIEKQTVLVGTEFLRPGHRCFEINTITLEVCEAVYELEFNYRGNFYKRKINVKPDCVYINALNKKNALKVYRKGGRLIVKSFMNINEYPLDHTQIKL